MAAALARHDALMRDAIQAHGGHIFKTVGDAFCAAFAHPQQAVAAALDAQRALHAEDFSIIDGLRVRMALHAGTAEQRDGDYFGPAVNRVARLLAIGHGGQVLVSGTAGSALSAAMPPQVGMRDLGKRRLKDLASPEHVFQLLADGLPQDFPALQSLDELHNNLPQVLSSFVGRENDTAEIGTIVCNNRLVTLVGAGGVGKTRCAQQAGAALLDASGEGVWFVELARITDESLVTAAIAKEFGVREAPNRPLLETLIAYLKRRRLLLILDNCEHVIAQARTIATEILRNCPHVRILATSRERLNISGEQVYRLPSLGVPATDGISAKQVSQYGAIQLFTDRARSSDKRFTLNDEIAPDVAEICRRLDGIPLAIELAAARVKVLSPKQLLQKLDERFRVLTGGDSNALPRQQTMRALIDWSYNLLPEEERALFRNLSIFVGGFTLETVTAVSGDETRDELAVLDRLSSLVDKSLVQTDPAADETRYGLLESTRQYASEKLIESGKYEAVAGAHATAYLALAEKFEQTYDVTPDLVWFSQAAPELENWRAALTWSFGARGDVVLGQRLACCTALHYAPYIGAAEGRRWVGTALQRVDTTTCASIAAKLELSDAALAIVLSQHKAAYAMAERAFARYREIGDPLGIARAQRILGRLLLLIGRREEGEGLLREALANARSLVVRKLEGWALEGLAWARQEAGDIEGVRTYSRESLAIANQTGAVGLAADASTNLAEAEFRAGNVPAALEVGLEGLLIQRSRNDPTIALCNIAAYLVALERYDEARSYGLEALTVTRDAQYEVFFAFALQHLAAVAAHKPGDNAEHVREDRTRAARLMGYVDARIAGLDALREYTEQQEYDKIFSVLRRTFGEHELASLIRDGQALSEEQAVAEAMLV